MQNFRIITVIWFLLNVEWKEKLLKCKRSYHAWYGSKDSNTTQLCKILLFFLQLLSLLSTNLTCVKMIKINMKMSLLKKKDGEMRWLIKYFFNNNGYNCSLIMQNHGMWKLDLEITILNREGLYNFSMNYFQIMCKKTCIISRKCNCFYDWNFMHKKQVLIGFKRCVGFYNCFRKKGRSLFTKERNHSLKSTTVIIVHYLCKNQLDQENNDFESWGFV